MKPVAAVIPAFNEERHIGSVVADVKKFVDEVIVVDDGSSDTTSDAARRVGAFVVRHRQNCGAGAATMTGIEAARRRGHQIVVTIDADGQHDVNDIPRLLEAIESCHADLVIANRFGRKNNVPFVRRLFNALGNLVTFSVTGLFLADSQSGFKAFSPKALKQVDLRMSGFEFCSEIVREAARYRWRIVSVPTKVLYSEYTLAKGQSFSSGVRTAMKILLRSFLR